jgi:transcriptional regulator with XRE-family HTH domain
METYKELKQRVRREQQLVARLRLATTRLADADRERIWAIVAAHEAGLSIRKIAAATGLSSSRVHQLLQSEESREIPTWLSQLREPELVDGSPLDADPSSLQPSIASRLAEEVEVFRWCLDWLERLEHSDEVVVNLRPETEDETAFVPFDRPRVLQVLARIAADLDALVRTPFPPIEAPAEDTEDPRARHRRRLAEPEPTPRRLSMQEERAALREALGLSPYTRR